jgi:hypothetical protein
MPPTDAGYNPDRVLTPSLTLPPAGDSTAASIRNFQRDLFMRASALPGVRSPALVTDIRFERYENRVLSAERVEVAGRNPSNTNLFVGLWTLFPDARDSGDEGPSVFGCRSHRAARRRHRQRAGWRGPSGRDRMPSASACDGGQRRGKPEPLAHHNRREWRFTWESSVERAVRSTLWQSRLGLNSAGPLKESIGLPANLRVSQEFRKDRCVRSVSQTKCLRRGYAGVGDYELL